MIPVRFRNNGHMKIWTGILQKLYSVSIRSINLHRTCTIFICPKLKFALKILKNLKLNKNALLIGNSTLLSVLRLCKRSKPLLFSSFVINVGETKFLNIQLDS